MAGSARSDVRIGVDFDNTIADYDDVFRLAACQEGLVGDDFLGGKAAVRAATCALEGGEERWMRLQGKVYGALMGHARLVDGFIEFLVEGRKAGVAVYIVSHKTEYGHFDAARVNLREAAWRWMTAQGFFDRHGLSRDRVFFEATRQDKIERIRRVGCSHYIDDLAEVFVEPTFPEGVDRHLLSREAGGLPSGPFTAYRNWREITDALFA